MNKYIKPILALFATLVCVYFSYAQKPKQIEIVNANTFEFDQNIGNRVKRLLGDVVFKQDNVLMYCDSAYFYSDINSLDAFGKVHIKQGDSINAWGDMLKYNGNLKQAVLTNNVKLTDGDMTLTTKELFYDTGKNVASYNTPAKIINKDNTLTSDLGYYYANQKNLFFKRNVVLTNPKYLMNCDTLRYNTASKTAYFMSPTKIKGKTDYMYAEDGWYDTSNDIAEVHQNSYYESKEKRLKGDHLYYNRKTAISIAKENVMLIDTTQKIKVQGSYGEFYEKENKAFITGKALLTQFINRDTLYLHADTLFAVNDTLKKTKTLFAFHRVKFYMEQMQGMADSLIYNYSDSIITMFYKPTLWNEDNQILADTIFITMQKGQFKELKLRNASFIVAELDSSKFNQIKGLNMNGYFINNELRKIEVRENGETVYFPEENKGKDYIGLNKAESKHLLISIGAKNKVEKITFIKDPDATLYPLKDALQEDYFLENFIWKDNYRPKFPRDVFIWGKQ
jgi:lipopolysaccharide transport protein LptA